MHRTPQSDRTRCMAVTLPPEPRSYAAACLCELDAESILSPREDNCNRLIAEFYSASLHKGKPVERRGRKASGPKAHERRIAGLPAAASFASARRHPAFLRTTRSFQSLMTPPHCGGARFMHRHVARAWVEEEGAAQVDTGKPVERRGRKASGLKDRILRQRGCHMSTQLHVTVNGLWQPVIIARAHSIARRTTATSEVFASQPAHLHASPAGGRAHASLNKGASHD
jgi:hypothetical protein